MKRIFIPLYLFTLLLLVASTARAQEKVVKRSPAQPTTSISGKVLFREYCAVCHGVDGKGNGPAVGALKQAPGDLTQIARRNGGKFPEDRVLRVIKGTEPHAAHGSQDMPMWGPIFSNMGDLTLAQTRIHSLLNYVQQLQK